MKKTYIAPELFVDEYVADTMIASSGGGKLILTMPGGGPKNGNAGNNQNCWGCDIVAGAVEDGWNACLGDSLSSVGSQSWRC